MAEFPSPDNLFGYPDLASERASIAALSPFNSNQTPIRTALNGGGLNAAAAEEQSGCKV